VEQAGLDEAEVPAEQLRQVRVGLGEPDEQAEELRDRRAEPAVLPWHTELAEAGIPQPLDLLERQPPVGLALDRAGSDPGEHRREPLDQLLVRERTRPGHSRPFGCLGHEACSSRGRAVSNRCV
jgi:hypothetical protein